MNKEQTIIAANSSLTAFFVCFLFNNISLLVNCTLSDTDSSHEHQNYWPNSMHAIRLLHLRHFLTLFLFYMAQMEITQP